MRPPDRVGDPELLSALSSGLPADEALAWIRAAEVTRWRDRVRARPRSAPVLTGILYEPDPDIERIVFEALETDRPGIEVSRELEDGSEPVPRWITDRLRELAEWSLAEAPDGAPTRDLPGLVARLHVLREQARLPDPEADDLEAKALRERDEALAGEPSASPLGLTAKGAHELYTLPWGIAWCRRCGALLRRGETSRFYLPGVGESPVDPGCTKGKTP